MKFGIKFIKLMAHLINTLVQAMIIWLWLFPYLSLSLSPNISKGALAQDGAFHTMVNSSARAGNSLLDMIYKKYHPYGRSMTAL